MARREMYEILHQFPVSSTPAKVFDAFTTPAGLSAWWTFEAEGSPELDQIYRFYFGPEYDWRARVIHVVPGLQLTWQMTQAMEDWLPTQVGFQITPKASECAVRFFHRNWPHDGDHYAITCFCWGQLLRGLKDYVETGVVVPFAKRN
jgi:uncharacterized protein YndB with AHSA1/START domain